MDENNIYVVELDEEQIFWLFSRGYLTNWNACIDEMPDNLTEEAMIDLERQSLVKDATEFLETLHLPAHLAVDMVEMFLESLKDEE